MLTMRVFVDVDVGYGDGRWVWMSKYVYLAPSYNDSIHCSFVDQKLIYTI